MPLQGAKIATWPVGLVCAQAAHATSPVAAMLPGLQCQQQGLDNHQSRQDQIDHTQHASMRSPANRRRKFAIWFSLLHRCRRVGPPNSRAVQILILQRIKEYCAAEIRSRSVGHAGLWSQTGRNGVRLAQVVYLLYTSAVSPPPSRSSVPMISRLRCFSCVRHVVLGPGGGGRRRRTAAETGGERLRDAQGAHRRDGPGRAELRRQGRWRNLMEAAIRGVLAKLDPYSAYLGPEECGGSGGARKRVRRHRHPGRHRGRPIDDPQSVARHAGLPLGFSPATTSSRSRERAPVSTADERSAAPGG